MNSLVLSDDTQKRCVNTYSTEPYSLLSYLATHNRSDDFSTSMEKEIVTEIEINASPSRVWQVLTDFEKYPTWNLFIKKISGIATRNEKLEVHMPDPSR